MQQISLIQIKLTPLQELVLIELNKTNNNPFICKKLGIKQISLTKTIQSLIQKNLYIDSSLTDDGKKMVHYLEFKNETISLFLKKHHLNTEEYKDQLSKLDYKLIILLRNLI